MVNVAVSTSDALQRLVTVVRRLRDPQSGCAWDLAQTHASLAPFAIEEAYELADAIEAGDDNDVRDELGDVVLQVVLHAQLASERDAFGLADVLDSISDKMERRHPHIFGDAPPADWEAIKATERASKADRSALAGVAAALPALSRAAKLGVRAAGVGFDWKDANGVLDKVVEELGEIAGASDMVQRQEEFGDLLFTLVSWGRHAGIEAEAALREANAKFERRFRLMEAAEPSLGEMDATGLERAWARAKTVQRAEKRDQSASDSRTDSASDPLSATARSSTSPRS